MEEKRCAALCGEVRDVDMYCHDGFVFSPSRRRGKGDLFTVRGLPVSFIQSCESVTTRIVGYRCARKEDSRSHVEREGAYYHQKREQTQETALALANAIFEIRFKFTYVTGGVKKNAYKLWAPCAAAIFSIGTTYTTKRHSLCPMKLMRKTKPIAGRTRDRIWALRAKPNGVNTEVTMTSRGRKVEK